MAGGVVERVFRDEPLRLARFHGACSARLGLRRPVRSHDQTLLCGDLFTQGGADCPPITEGDILGPGELFRKPMDYFAHAAHGNAVLEKLAALRPEMLACMHGSSYRGDGGSLLRELAAVLERERFAMMPE